MEISVVIPCHNGARWIASALRSVSEQTHPPLETIVVDDASTDGSIDQIEAAGTDIRLLQVDARSASVARNTGAELATGDWIAFLDADDVWYPDHLYCAVRILEGTGDVGYLGHADAFSNRGGDTVTLDPLPVASAKTGLFPEQFLKWSSRRIFFLMPTCLVRKEILLSCGGFDPESRREGIDMWLRAIHGRTWAYNPVATVAYRYDTPGSISRNIPQAEYYLLRGLLHNRGLYPGRTMEKLIHRTGRSAMRSAIIRGNADDRRRARELAWRHLPFVDKVIFAVGRCFVPLFMLGAWVRRVILRQKH